jgi:hypothetical protein
MQTITTIGLDIAKSVFQVHGVDAAGQVVIRRQFKRRHVLAFFEKLPPCLVGIEACASSHHWSRELQALSHIVRLMPPAYVKPYVKRQKNDMADAEAICEAVTRANMRFVPFCCRSRLRQAAWSPHVRCWGKNGSGSDALRSANATSRLCYGSPLSSSPATMQSSARTSMASSRVGTAAQRDLSVEPVVISGAGHGNIYVKYAAQVADACVKDL